MSVPDVARPGALLVIARSAGGKASSFTIVPVPVSFVMVAPVAPLSLTVKASLSSKVVSAQTWTVMVLLGSLGAKVRVRARLMSSDGRMSAAALLLLKVAVPSTVVKPTVTDWVVVPLFVTVKVKAAVPRVLGSAWLTSAIASVFVVSSFTIVLYPLSLHDALPISPLSLTVKASLSSKVVSAQTWTVMVLLGSLGAKVSVPVRSEERRVGKEWSALREWQEENTATGENPTDTDRLVSPLSYSVQPVP